MTRAERRLLIEVAHCVKILMIGKSELFYKNLEQALDNIEDEDRHNEEMEAELSDIANEPKDDQK